MATKRHSFETSTEVVKVDDSLGLVMGFAVVCKVDGEEYYDYHGDHIDEATMLEAAAAFMADSRIATDMHARDADGNPVAGGAVVFAFPLTEDVAKAFEIETKKTGLMIAIKPSDPEVLRKYRDGTYTGFSIAGRCAFLAEAEDEEA